MTDEYSLWKVTLSYQVPIDLAERERTVYRVVAQRKDEAETKSLAHFSGTATYKYFNLSPENIQTTVTRTKKQKITLPLLTLEEDRANFEIIPKLSWDNSSLEFLVSERKGR